MSNRRTYLDDIADAIAKDDAKEIRRESAIACQPPNVIPFEPAPVNEAYVKQIEWESLVVDVDGVKGISLRRLVELGLYVNYRDASTAAQNAGMAILAVSANNPGKGRPGQDILFLNPREAQKFCMRTRSAVGEQIADLILDQHDEFQKLLNGDKEAHQQLAKVAHQPLDIDPALALSDDKDIQLLLAMARQRAVLIAQEQRTVELEREAQRTREDQQRLAEQQARQAEVLDRLAERVEAPQGWLTLTQVAQVCGVYSTTGLPHSQAINQIATDLGLDKRTRLVEIPGSRERALATFLDPAMVTQIRGTINRIVGRDRGPANYQGNTGPRFKIVLRAS